MQVPCGANYRHSQNNSRPLEVPLLVLPILNHGENPRLLSSALTLTLRLRLLVFLFLYSFRPFLRASRQASPTIPQVLQLTASQLRTLNTKDERYGVHEIRLAGAIRANDGGKVIERSNCLVPTVGLDIHPRVRQLVTQAAMVKGSRRRKYSPIRLEVTYFYAHERHDFIDIPPNSTRLFKDTDAS